MFSLVRFFKVPTFCLILGGVTGCGQSGPLYYPDQPPPITVPDCPTCPKS